MVTITQHVSQIPTCRHHSAGSKVLESQISRFPSPGSRTRKFDRLPTIRVTSRSLVDYKSKGHRQEKHQTLIWTLHQIDHRWQETSRINNQSQSSKWYPFYENNVIEKRIRRWRRRIKRGGERKKKREEPACRSRPSRGQTGWRRGAPPRPGSPDPPPTPSADAATSTTSSSRLRSTLPLSPPPPAEQCYRQTNKLPIIPLRRPKSVIYVSSCKLNSLLRTWAPSASAPVGPTRLHHTPRG